MKKITGLLSIVMISSSISACSSESVNSIQPAVQNNTQQVTAQSAQGLKTFYSKVVDKTFAIIDKDKNKSVSLDEFMNRTNINIPGLPASSAVVDNTERNPGVSPVDVRNLFTQIDKNKNNKLSLTEARNNSRLFLGMTKTQLRTLVGKTMFGGFDRNSDKYISKAEFLGDPAINSDSRTSTLLTSLFYNSDRNSDNKLSFTEFEDFAYSMIKSLWDNPAPPPTPVPSEPVEPPAENPAPTDPAQPPTDTPADPAQPPSETPNPSEPSAPTDVQ